MSDYENNSSLPVDYVVSDEDASYSEKTEDEYKEQAVKEEEYYPLPKDPKKRTMLFSVISVILSVLSIGLSVFYIPALILAVLALGFALYSRYILG